MADKVSDRLAAGQAERAVKWPFILIYAAAMVGVWMAVLTPVIVTLPLRVHQIAPNDEAGVLSLVLGVGAILAMIGNPLFGRLSDATTSPWGMRRPWLLGGVAGGLAGVGLIASTPSVTALLVGWCLVQLSCNAIFAALYAVLPDQIPVSQRGVVSGILGMGLPLGQILGAFLAQAVGGSMVAMLLLPAAVASVGIVALAYVLPDRRIAKRERTPQSLGQWLKGFLLDPKDSPDFAWAWLSRFLFMLGLAFVLTYQALYLINRLGAAPTRVPQLIFEATVVSSLAISVASVLGGKLSDFLRRRKVFVAGAAAVYAAGLWVIAASQTFDHFLLGMGIAGFGQGLYLGVDLALVTDVLPARETEAAKNLGIFNIASTLPQSIAPTIAPAILFLGSGNYAWLFIAAGAFSLIGALAIIPVKQVR